MALPICTLFLFDGCVCVRVCLPGGVVTLVHHHNETAFTPAVALLSLSSSL